MTTQYPSSLRLIVISGIAAAWLAVSGYTLYALQISDQQIFDPEVLSDSDPFSPTRAQSFFTAISPITNVAKLFFLVDPACSCSAATVAHLIDLTPELIAQQTQLVVVTPERSGNYGETLVNKLRKEHKLEARSVTLKASETLIPSSPAAVLISATQELVYFGPWSAGAACVSGTSGFVESALLALKEAKPISVINRSAVGCYCPWPGTHQRKTKSLVNVSNAKGVEDGSA